MPLSLTNSAPTLLVRKEAFERTGFTRADVDRALTLTDEEFRVEGSLIAIGPVFEDAGFDALLAAFEAAGLVHFEDFFDLSGNWPEWIEVFVRGARGARGAHGAGETTSN